MEPQLFGPHLSRFSVNQTTEMTAILVKSSDCSIRVVDNTETLKNVLYAKLRLFIYGFGDMDFSDIWNTPGSKGFG